MIEVRTNLPEFKRQMQSISDDFKNKAVKAAVRAAGGVFRQQARAVAPVLKQATKQRIPETLRRNIYVGIPKQQQAGVVRGVVAVRSGRKSQKGATDPFYWRFLEGGWIPRGPGNRLRGGVRTRALERRRSASRKISYPFLAPAWQSMKSQALSKFYEKLDQAIQKYNALK